MWVSSDRILFRLPTRIPKVGPVREQLGKSYLADRPLQGAQSSILLQKRSESTASFFNKPTPVTLVLSQEMLPLSFLKRQSSTRVCWARLVSKFHYEPAANYPSNLLSPRRRYGKLPIKRTGGFLLPRGLASYYA